LKGEKLSHIFRTKLSILIDYKQWIIKKIHLGICSLIGHKQYYNNVLVLCMVDGPEPSLKSDGYPDFEEDIQN